MALVKCSECGKEISDRAKTCIGCGAPIAAEDEARKSDEAPGTDFSPNIQSGEQPITIERTGKKWKLQILLALGTIVVGIIIIAVTGVAATASHTHVAPVGGVAFGSVVILAGLFWFVGAAIAAWWHHG